MGNLEIWYKRVNESKYHRILDFVNRAENLPILTWTKDVSNKLQEFDLHLYNPIDEDSLPIFPKSGDSIAITDFQNNIFNNTFFGVVMSKEYEPIGVTASNDTNWVYTLKVQAPNFSTQEITLDYINSVYINDILPIIFNNTPSLGGILSNGIVISKHNYGGENFLLPPPKFQGEQFDCLVKILDSIGWTFGYYYYSELNSVTGLHIVKQIDMFPKNFLKSAPQDWQDGFNFNIYKNGLLANPDYPNLDDNKYIFGENKVSLSEDSYQSKNAIKLKLFIKNSTGEGTKKVITSTGLTDTYNLGGAFEIKSIAIKVFDENGIDVKVKTVTSTTVFTVGAMVSSTINFYQQRLLDNGLGTKMRCKIISSSVEYFSYFTINNSTQTITLDTAVSGLAINDTFELVNCYDILRENLLGYPPDVNGYIVKKLDNEQSTITFTEYDRPEAKKQIVVYYYPITQLYKMQVDSLSIEQTGYRGLTETIKDAVTTEQAEEIFNEYLKLMKPLKELNLLSSHRKSILDINTNVPVVFGDINQNLIVVESSGKILSNYGFYRNKPLIVQDKIRLASYKNNIDDILLKIQNQSLAIQNMNLLNDIQEFTIDEDIFEEIGDNALNELITPIMQDPSNILFDRFTMNFISSNVTSYRVLVGNDIDFTDKIVYNLGIVSDPETLTSADLSIGSLSYPVWVKIQAIRGTELSSFSNVKQANFIDTTDLKIFSNLKNNSLVDNSSFGNDLVLGNGATFTANPVFSSDTTSVYLDGTNDYAYVNHDSSIDSVDFTFEFAFKLHSIDAFMVLVSRYDNILSNLNLKFYSAIISDKLSIYLYDETIGSGGASHNYTEIMSTSANSFVINTQYIVQFSWNNTTKAYNLVLNRNNIPCSENISPNAGVIPSSSLNIRTTENSRVLLGAYTASGSVYASGSYLRVGRLRYWTKSHTLSALQSLYDNLITT